MGRTKEPFIPWEDWEQDIISLYSEGASDIEIRGLIAEKMEDRETLSWDLWDRWLEDEPIFSEAIKKGRAFCEIWWQKQGRTNLENREFSPTLWYMNMRNRFGWRDQKPDNPNTGNDITKVADALEKIADSLPG